jgi:hypothetical protein
MQYYFVFLLQEFFSLVWLSKFIPEPTFVPATYPSKKKVGMNNLQG